MQSWRLLIKLSESVSTFTIVQKMWFQWPFFYACTKIFGIEEVYVYLLVDFKNQQDVSKNPLFVNYVATTFKTNLYNGTGFLNKPGFHNTIHRVIISINNMYNETLFRIYFSVYK